GHTRFSRDWSSDVCSSDLGDVVLAGDAGFAADGDGFADAAFGGHVLDAEVFETGLGAQEANDAQQGGAGADLGAGFALAGGAVDAGDVHGVAAVQTQEGGHGAVGGLEVGALQLAATDGLGEGGLERVAVESVEFVAAGSGDERSGLQGGLAGERQAGERDGVGVAGAIDEHAGAQGVQALFAAKLHVPSVVVEAHGGRQGVQAEFDAGVEHERVGQRGVDRDVDGDLQLVVRHLAPGGKVGQAFAGFAHDGGDEFPAYAGDDLAAPGVEEAGQVDPVQGGRAAEHTAFFNEQGAGAGARGLGGGDDAGGAAAEHDDIEGTFGRFGIHDAGDAGGCLKGSALRSASQFSPL